MTTKHQEIIMRLFLVNIVDEYKEPILAYLTQAYNNHLNLPHPIHCKTHKKTNNLNQKNQAVAHREMLIFFQSKLFIR